MQTYVIQIGDTFYSIAKKFNVPLVDLYMANKELVGVNHMEMAGRTVIIPKKVDMSTIKKA